jgi:predicted protein tyrosine phosphatase
MIKIITYPKRLFDKMVNESRYKESDYFISIGHSSKLEGDEPSIPKSKNFLRLEYDDVLYDVLGNKGITVEQSNQTIDFVSTIWEHNFNDINIHIHCQAGQSRSTGTAVSIADVLKSKGYDIWFEHLGSEFYPNKRVMSFINDAWRLRNNAINSN